MIDVVYNTYPLHSTVVQRNAWCRVPSADGGGLWGGAGVLGVADNVGVGKIREKISKKTSKNWQMLNRYGKKLCRSADFDVVCLICLDKYILMKLQT